MISLVLPTYNGAKFLRPQLDSIFSQTVVPDEVIVIDDCSTDSTMSILEEYRDRFNLKIYKNDSNLGYNNNFQKGISLATGDYICLCDQDDVWLKNKIEVSLTKIKEIEGDLPACVSSNCYVVDENLKKLSNSPLFQKNDSDFEESLCYYSFQGCSLMFNRKLKDMLFPFPDFCNYDIYIGIYSVFVGNRLSIGEPLMYYRQHGHNAIGTSDNKPKTNLDMGCMLYTLIDNQKRKRLFEYLLREKKILKSKEDMLNKYIALYSKDSLIQIISNIIIFPYYNFTSKIYAILLALKVAIKNLL